MTTLDPLRLSLRTRHLIEASAGTGKTHTIASLFVRLVVELDLPVDQILVVTFTEAAASELRDRIRSRLRSAAAAFAGAPTSDPLVESLVAARRGHPLALADHHRLDLAVRSFDQASISTIHGFCQRVLRDCAFESGAAFSSELVVDERPLIELVTRDYWIRELHEADPLFIERLYRARMKPSDLLRLAQLAVANHDAPIVPDTLSNVPPPDIAPFRDAYAEVREQWHTARAEVTEMLLSHGGLHKARYRKDAMVEWFAAMDSFVSGEKPRSLGFPELTRFAAETLEANTNKAHRARGHVPRHAFFDACTRICNALAPLGQHFELLATDFKRRLADYVRSELPHRKRAAGQRSFDDLLRELDVALRSRRTGKALAATVRSRYRAALIDEFQDTDPLQYRIFRSIFEATEHPLLLIGDPKQAIYGFRGADVFAYLEAARTVGHVHTLNTNWRSDPALVEAVGHLFDVRNPFWLPEIAFHRVGARERPHAAVRCGTTPLPAFEIKLLRSTEATRGTKTHKIKLEAAVHAIAPRIAADIATLLAGDATIADETEFRPVRAGDVAVLVRKNAQAQQIQGELRRLGIPAVVYGDASVFATPEASELQRVLAAVAEPSRDTRVRAALTTELLGVTASHLEELLDDEVSWNHWVQLFRHWHTVWTTRGFIQMFRLLLAASGATARLLALLDGERRVTNLLHLAELLHTSAAREHLGPPALLRWFQDERRRPQSDLEASKLRLERDDAAVQLVTVHRSKGLEYPIVYVPYAWMPENLTAADLETLTFHDPNNANRLTLDISPKGPWREAERTESGARAKFEVRAESVRLLYVALTRARHRCVVVWGDFERAHHSALGYLLWSPADDANEAWDPERIAANIKASDDESAWRWLETRSAGHFQLSWLADTAPITAPPGLAGRGQLVARSPRGTVDRLFRTSSFTGLSAGRRTLQADDGHDYDRGRGPAVWASDLPHGNRTIRLVDFPRGAHVGTMFHEILEHLDFSADAETRKRVVAAGLVAHGMRDPDTHAVADLAIEDVLQTRLLAGSDGPRLVDIPPGDRLDELAFVFPASSPDPTAAIRPDDLASVFERYPDGLPPDYSRRLRGLAFTPLRGYVKGFIDLVFRWSGRYFVVDYKTNHLGDELDSYRPEALAEVMSREHYVLQYHLYCLAVHRFLRTRIHDYRYARDFGGVLYLFLRGMTPACGADSGIHFALPCEQRISALDALMDAAQVRR